MLTWTVLLSIFLVACVAQMIFGFIRLMALTLMAIFRLSQSVEHWLCLGVTLLVTTVFAVVFRGRLEGTTLWLVALSAGVVSGAASEVARLVTGALEKYLASVTTLPSDYLFDKMWANLMRPT